MQLADLMLLARRFVMSVGASPAYPNGRRFYSGVYHDGRAVYFYDDSGNGRIYGGKFWFSRMTYVQPKGRIKETAYGLFGNGRKQGRWLFTYRTFGLRRSLYVDYADGRRAGCYVYRSRCSSRLLGFKKGTTLLTVGVSGHDLTGQVYYSFGGESLTGRSDSAGRPDGRWTMNAVKTRSHKIFHETWEHGVCVSSDIFDVTTGDKTTGKGRFPDVILSVVYSECKPLEHILRKGTK